MNTGKVMLLGGATFKVKGPANTTWTLTDNVLPDGDPVSGQFKLAGLSPGSYEVCEIVAPPDYLLPELACHATMVYDGATTLVETFISKRKPTIVVWFQDLMKNPVVGATIIVKDSLGNQILIATDNAWQDHDATAGKIVVQLPAAMKGSMCMFTPPVGYIFGYPPDKLCMPFALAGDMGAGFGPYPVLPIPSASWSLTNGSLGNLGYTVLGVPGATFKVTNPKLFSSIDVVDNGANDLDATVGKVLVKLPMAGTYNLCEVLPPVGYLSATPACRKVDVTSGGLLLLQATGPQRFDSLLNSS
jgi:uncharacterized surface anchored protein